MNKSTKTMLGIIACLVIIAGILIPVTLSSLNGESNSSSSSLSSDTVTAVESSSNVQVTYTSSEESGTYTNYNAKINLDNMEVEGSGVSISGTTIKVTSAGTYYFSGTAEDANIVVEADKNADVVLVFENANITSTKTAVINGVKAKTITVNLASESTNTFTDSSTYTVFTEDDEPNATVFSKTDLVINGSGKLIINSNYEDGIVSKDTLRIVGANIEITAKDDGIRGKDYTAIKNSTITIKSGGDGIKSTNTDDTSLGYVLIEDSTINITAENDGIQAETVLTMTNSDINIKTTGDKERYRWKYN